MATSTTPSLVSIHNLHTTTRVDVTFRERTCNCGCGGRDSQHRVHGPRTLRNVSVLGEPRPLVTRHGDTCPHRVVVAVADVRAPWGEVVHAQAVAFVNGTFARWQLRQLR